jgi:hypothetical protein
MYQKAKAGVGGSRGHVSEAEAMYQRALEGFYPTRAGKQIASASKRIASASEQIASASMRGGGEGSGTRLQEQRSDARGPFEHRKTAPVAESHVNPTGTGPGRGKEAEKMYERRRRRCTMGGGNGIGRAWCSVLLIAISIKYSH